MRAAIRNSARAATLAVALALGAGAAAQDFVWDDRPPTAGEAARLFDTVCLATLPDFAAADALFDGLGFVASPKMRVRNHLQKNMSALATTPADLDASGIRSCAILVRSVGQQEAARAVEPVVAARFGGAAERVEMRAGGSAHILWSRETADAEIRVAVTESAGAAYLGATVIPRAAGARP